jgi:hypothetical protein
MICGAAERPNGRMAFLLIVLIEINGLEAGFKNIRKGGNGRSKKIGLVQKKWTIDKIVDTPRR